MNPDLDAAQSGSTQHKTSARAMVPWRPSPEELPEHPATLPCPRLTLLLFLLEVGWRLRGAWASWRGPEHVVRNDWCKLQRPGGLLEFIRMGSRHWEVLFTRTIFLSTFEPSWDYNAVLHPCGQKVSLSLSLSLSSLSLSVSLSLCVNLSVSRSLLLCVYSSLLHLT